MMRREFDIGVVFNPEHTGRNIYPKIPVPSVRLCINVSLEWWRQNERFAQNSMIFDPGHLQIEDEGDGGANFI